MEFRILGPLEVVEDGRRLDLGGPKQRGLLNNAYYWAYPRGYNGTLVIANNWCGVCTWQWLIDVLVWLLTFFHRFTVDWGIAIIILVFIVRALLHPITKKSQVHMMRMQKMGPELEKIKKKLELTGLMRPFSQEIFFGDRVAVLGEFGGLGIEVSHLSTAAMQPEGVVLYDAIPNGHAPALIELDDADIAECGLAGLLLEPERQPDRQFRQRRQARANPGKHDDSGNLHLPRLWLGKRSDRFPNREHRASRRRGSDNSAFRFGFHERQHSSRL